MAKRETTIIPVAVDAGRGMTIGLTLDKKKNYKRVAFASVRAEVTGQSLGLHGMELQFDYYDMFQQRFIFGDTLLDVTSSAWQDFISIDSSGSEFHQSLVLATLRDLDLPDGSLIHLGLLAPPGVFNEAQNKLIDAFLGEEFEVKRKGDGKPRRYTIAEVTCLPESFAASQLFVLDRNGQMILDGTTVDGNILLYDPGVLTVDTSVIRRGRLDQEGFRTDDRFGINELIREPIVKTIKGWVKDGHAPIDFEMVTVQHIDYVLRRGLNTGNYSLTMGGRSMNLKEAFELRFKAYYNVCKTNVIARAPYNNLRDIDLLVPMGGGGIIQLPFLLAEPPQFSDKVMRLDKHPSTKGLSPVDLNVAGLLHMMQMGGD